MRRIWFVSALGLTILLCACGSKETKENKVPELSDHETAKEETICCNLGMTVTDQGVIFPIDAQSGGVLQYFDYHTGSVYPFCSNVNCTHTDADCDGWFDSEVYGPAIYGDKIYLFTKNSDQNSWQFLSMDADGTNRKQITEIKAADFSCDDLMPTGNFWYNDETVIFTMQCTSWEEGEDHQTLAALNLSGGQVRIIGELDSGDSLLAYEKKQIFASREDSDEPILERDAFYEKMGASADYDAYYSEWYQAHHQTVYYLLDTETGERVDVLSISGSQEPAEWDYDHIADDGVYYGTAGNVIYGVDFSDKTLCIVYESETPKTIECAADGNVFFLELDENRENVTANCYLDVKTGEVTKLDGQLTHGGWLCGFAGGYFVGESKKGYICINKDDLYQSDFSNIAVMEE